MENKQSYAVFTEDMKQDYTILVPNMLPVQFGLMIQIMGNYGYHMELLATEGRAIVEQGLKNVHNDTCYPALLAIGQLMDAVESGKYDTHKIALIMSQTGGGCRASNYIHLLRKALAKNGYDYIPVISLNFSGLESNSGLHFTPQMLMQVASGVLLGDLIMMLHNQCRPYEVVPGSSQKAVGLCMDMISQRFTGNRMILYSEVRRLYDFILRVFGRLRLDRSAEKTRVGVVGEIYVKFSPLGNNHLEDFLIAEGCEPVLAGLLDFCMYCLYNAVVDHRLYGRSGKAAALNQGLYNFVLGKQKDLIRIIRKDGHFRPPLPFEEVR